MTQIAPRLAIYSANFGNYRNELTKLETLQFDKEIDYYFFTDNESITSDNWKIIVHPLLPELDFMNSFRHTAKYVKFVVPDILKQYDVIVWIDTKSLHHIQKISKEKIFNRLNVRPYTMHLIKFPPRQTPQQELKYTTNVGVECKESANVFLDKIRDMSFNAFLPDTTCMIFKNTPNNIDVMRKIYDGLIENRLRRDQNIIQYVFCENKHESNITSFIFPDIIYR
jgi:hypothetical protein